MKIKLVKKGGRPVEVFNRMFISDEKKQQGKQHIEDYAHKD